MPEALPSSSGLTAERTTFATGAKNIAMPVPLRMNGITSSVYGTVGVETAASHPSPIACSASPPAISGRPPIRSERAPAIGATIIGMAVHGRIRSPAPSGEWPCTVCRNCASRKIEPNIPKYMSREAPFAAANARSRKKRIGSIGAGARSSQATKAAVKSAPSPSEATICGLVHPSPLPFTSPQTRPNRPALASANPGRSRRLAGPWLSWRNA